MSYAKTANRVNPAAIIGAMGVPAAFGFVLVAGLAVHAVIVPPAPNPTGVLIEPKPLPEPPPPPEETVPQAEVSSQQNSTVVTPPTRPETDFDFSNSTPIETLVNPGPAVIETLDLGGPIGGAPIEPVLPDPVAASPANNPGRWITDRDYRSIWIRQDLSGVAGFALTIDIKGKVSDCTITRSTGHTALDKATCQLIQKRAKFDPAKDSNGNAVTGTFSSSVNWKIPE